MKMNVEFETLEEFEKFVKHFGKSNVETITEMRDLKEVIGKFNTEKKNENNFVQAKDAKIIPVVKNKKQMELLEKKVTNDLKSLNIVKESEKDCTFLGCSYPKKRHYHKTSTSETHNETEVSPN